MAKEAQESDPAVWRPTDWRPSPYAARTRELWAELSDGMRDVWPAAPGRLNDPSGVLDQTTSAHDAYHSLSIEGYQVTPALIERIAAGAPAAQDRDALAAFGYLRALDQVRASVTRAQEDADPTAVIDDLQTWRQAMFQPSVDAGLLAPGDAIGYRHHPVYIRGARHVPVPQSGLLDAMEAFRDAFAAEPEPAVRAIVGHLVLTWIHPFADGNGRLARFLMNTQLVTAGWPWTTIRVEQRPEYMAALDRASVERDIGPFAALVRETAVMGSR